MLIIGVDEVGRGCWAGPLVAGAVAFVGSESGETPLIGLDDSKKLSRKRREVFAPQIYETALAWGLGWVQPEAIDSGGITEAVKTAMLLAVTDVLRRLSDTEVSAGPVVIIVDGSYNFLQHFDVPRAYAGRLEIRTQVGADGLVPAVSAASIIAKTSRDEYMANEAERAYPGYGFGAHVGYGTAAHIGALGRYGVTPIHRKSYKPIQKFLLQSDA